MNINLHNPVLLQEVLTLLPAGKGIKLVDATLGGGGHSAAIIRTLVEKHTKFLHFAFDLDPLSWPRFQIALAEAGVKFKGVDTTSLEIFDGNSKVGKVVYKRQNFSDLVNSEEKDFNFILADLGLSQNQIKINNSGFTHSKTQGLDMRLDAKTQSVTAADILNKLHVKGLQKLLQEYAEVSNWPGLLEKILAFREIKQFSTTVDLNSIVFPAERNQVYQALRIAVNSEYDNLQSLIAAADLKLVSAGRLAIITFHSGEEKQVTNALKQTTKKLHLVKVLKPTSRELNSNNSSRSAKLYNIVKVD